MNVIEDDASIKQKKHLIENDIEHGIIYRPQMFTNRIMVCWINNYISRAQISIGWV